MRTDSMNNEMRIPIDEKLFQWRKEGRKIVQDEHGLNFYEGMTPREKIEWIENEIKSLKENVELLKNKEIPNKPDIDYRQEFYSERYGLVKPDPKIKNLQKQCEKYIEDRKKSEKEFIRKRKKEYQAEIKEYQEDIKYYEKQVSTPLTKSIVWLQNYLSKSGQKKESAIEVLRKRTEKGGFI